MTLIHTILNAQTIRTIKSSAAKNNHNIILKDLREVQTGMTSAISFIYAYDIQQPNSFFKFEQWASTKEYQAVENPSHVETVDFNIYYNNIEGIPVYIEAGKKIRLLKITVTDAVNPVIHKSILEEYSNIVNYSRKVKAYDEYFILQDIKFKNVFYIFVKGLSQDVDLVLEDFYNDNSYTLGHITLPEATLLNIGSTNTDPISIISETLDIDNSELINS